MRRAALGPLLLGAALSGASCRRTVSATEVMLVVHSDLAQGSALAGVRVVGVEPPDGDVPGLEVLRTTCMPIGDGQLRTRLPIVLGLYLPPGNTGHRLQVQVSGFSDGSCADRARLVTQSATVTFVEEEAQLLEVTLRAACVGASCPPGSTCGLAGATCAPDGRDPLPPYDPSSFDAGVDPADGAPLPLDALAPDGPPAGG